MKYFSAIALLFGLLLIASCSDEKGLAEGPVEFKLIPFQQSVDGAWGFCDLKGNKIIDTILPIEPTYFKEGFALSKKSNGAYDFVDTTGKLAGKEYLGATLFSEGLAAVVLENSAPFYINKQFEKVFELKFANLAGMFSHGLAKFQDENGKWGYVDKNGEIVIEPQFSYAASFSDSLAVVSITKENEAEKIGYIDMSGKLAIDLGEGVQSAGNFYNGRAVFEDSEGWGVLGPGGKKILSGKDWLRIGEFFYGYATFLTKDEKWGLLNRDGEIALEPEYNNSLIFANGLSPIVLDGKWGFIDLQGETVIKPVYQAVYIPFINETALVMESGKIQFINMDGKPASDNSLLNVNLDYQFIMDLDNVVMNETFNPVSIVNQIVPQLTRSSFYKLSGEVNVNQVVELFRLNYDELPKEAERVGIPAQVISKGLTGKIDFMFDGKVGNPDSKLKEFELTISLNKKNSAQMKMIFEEITRKFKEAGYTEAERDGEIFVEFLGDNVKARVMQMDVLVIISMDFNPAVS